MDNPLLFIHDSTKLARVFDSSHFYTQRNNGFSSTKFQEDFCRNKRINQLEIIESLIDLCLDVRPMGSRIESIVNLKGFSSWRSTMSFSTCTVLMILLIFLLEWAKGANRSEPNKSAT